MKVCRYVGTVNSKETRVARLYLQFHTKNPNFGLVSKAWECKILLYFTVFRYTYSVVILCMLCHFGGRLV
jgi:hypothetical protein